MLGICKIHQAGIVHSALGKSFSRHAARKRASNHRLLAGQKTPIAEAHTRLINMVTSRVLRRPWCIELGKLEGLYGMMSGDPATHREWSSLVPSLNSVTQLFSNIAFSG